MALRFGDTATTAPTGLIYGDQANFTPANTVTGSGAPASQAATITSTAVRGIQDVGTPPQLYAGEAVVVATGAQTTLGTGVLQAAAATVVGTGFGFNYVTGAGVLQAGVASASGEGFWGHGGLGVLQAQSATVAGAGELTGQVFGIGACAAGTAAVVGVGSRVITGAGMLVPPQMVVAGDGLVVAIAVNYVCYLPPNTLPLEVLPVNVSYEVQFDTAKSVPTSVTVGWDDLVTYHAGNPPATETAYNFSNDKTFVEDQDE